MCCSQTGFISCISRYLFWIIHKLNKFTKNGLNLQCCLAGSSKAAIVILISSTAMNGNVMVWPSIQANFLTFDILVFLEDINLGLGILDNSCYCWPAWFACSNWQKWGNYQSLAHTRKQTFLWKFEFLFVHFRWETVHSVSYLYTADTPVCYSVKRNRKICKFH